MRKLSASIRVFIRSSYLIFYVILHYVYVCMYILHCLSLLPSKRVCFNSLLIFVNFTSLFFSSWSAIDSETLKTSSVYGIFAKHFKIHTSNSNRIRRLGYLEYWRIIKTLFDRYVGLPFIRQCRHVYRQFISLNKCLNFLPTSSFSIGLHTYHTW